MEKQIILKYLKQYLDKHNVEYSKCGVNMIALKKCIYCEQEFSATQIPNNPKIACKNSACKKRYTVIEIAQKVENLTGTEEEILHHIKEDLNINVVTSIDQKNIVELFEFYKENGFDLVPIAKNKKYPIEKDWTNKEHKNPAEWQRWILDGLNIGIKTGVRSGITILDIDQKPIPEEIKKIMGDTLIQESTNGYHLFYKYEKELPKTRIDEFKIDLENDGGQVVIAPSKINEIIRKITVKPVIAMSKELKKLIKSKMTVPRKTMSEELKEDIIEEDFNLGILKKGSRNSSLIRLGGLFRKQLNSSQTEYVINVLNKHACDKPLPRQEINAMARKLEHYSIFDEKELAHKTMEYMKIVEDASRNEIALAIAGSNRGEDKKRIDKALSYLIKEGFLIKKGRSYGIIQKAEWKTDLIDEGKPIDFEVPYFSDMANFNWGDLILIGSKNKKGKTHISMNIVKRLVEQGKVPYYISLETGSRFKKIALQLGLKEGDFKHSFQVDPTRIELEPNAITIIDWLLVIDKSKTDLVFRHLVEQLYKTNGIIICFQQLKEDDGYFAPNMAKQFPALSARYLYDNEDSGEYGYFKVDVVREPKMNIKTYDIPCRYDWETKELKKIEDDERPSQQEEKDKK